MKTNFCFAVCIAAFINKSCLLAQNNAVRKVLLSLQAGERIVNNESCIELSYSANQLYLVTQQGQNFFIYEGGQRKGPYKSMDQIKEKNCGNNNNHNCSVYDPEQRDNMGDYITMTESGEMAIKFNGKTFGPYKMVTAMHVPPDKSWFVALTMNSEMKTTIVSSDYPTQPVNGNASELQASISGKQYLLAVKEGDGFDPELLKTDFSKMTQDQLIKFMQQQEEKKKKAGPPKAYVYTNGGKKFGPYPAQSISNNNPAFCKSGGGNWYMVLDNELYINGTSVKKFSYDEINVSTCNVWLSADGKKYAVTSYDKIIFSDGTSFTAPLKLEADGKDGKTMIKWISLENEKDLVAYTKDL